MEVITVDESKEFFDKSRKIPYLTVIVKIPEELYPPIESIQRELQRIDSRQLYCPSNYFHITLKGIGSPRDSIEESKMPKIIDALERVARANRSFKLEFGSLGIFPDVIYVGINGGANELRRFTFR